MTLNSQMQGDILTTQPKSHPAEATQQYAAPALDKGLDILELLTDAESKKKGGRDWEAVL